MERTLDISSKYHDIILEIISSSSSGLLSTKEVTLEDVQKIDQELTLDDLITYGGYVSDRSGDAQVYYIHIGGFLKKQFSMTDKYYKKIGDAMMSHIRKKQLTKFLSE